MSKHVFECPSSSPDPLAADCQCSRLRASQESMRTASIAAIEAMPGIGSFMPGRGSTLSRASVLEALREIQP
jgi:hypothetical protein